MKNLVAVLVVTAASVAIMVIVLFAVNRKPDSRLNVSSKMQVTSSAVIRVIKFQGHEYLAYNINKGGSLCHSETCPCTK